MVFCIHIGLRVEAWSANFCSFFFFGGGGFNFQVKLIFPVSLGFFELLWWHLRRWFCGTIRYIKRPWSALQHHCTSNAGEVHQEPWSLKWMSNFKRSSHHFLCKGFFITSLKNVGQKLSSQKRFKTLLLRDSCVQPSPDLALCQWEYSLGQWNWAADVTESQFDRAWPQKNAAQTPSDCGVGPEKELFPSL